jgi:putative Holliday junction resolvase
MSEGLPGQGKLVAVDLGLARIGVAVCDPLRLAARPLTILTRASRRQDFDRLATLVRTQEAVGVVCGLPLNMDGSEGPQAATTRKWAMRLAHALRAILGYPVPVALWDERLSSFTARALFDRRELVHGDDAAAAAVILQSYLDAAARGEAQAETIHLPPRTLAAAAEE